MSAHTPDVRQNFFELFDLPVSSRIDGGVLRGKYMTLQKQFHPDRYAAADEQHRRVAAQIAARVNEAHQTLSDPLRCAEYCLSLMGIDVGSETDTSMDPRFLMEQMEWRESLEELIESGGRARAKLALLRDEINGHIDRISVDVARHLDDRNGKEARDLIRRWQFLAKIDKEAQSVGASLPD